MNMGNNFKSAEELWYSLRDDIKNLKNYEDLGKLLEKIGNFEELFKKLINEISFTYPEYYTKIKEIAKNVKIEDLKKLISDNYEKYNRIMSLERKESELSSRYTALKNSMTKIEKEIIEVCTNYAKKKEEYSKKTEIINKVYEKELYDIRTSFYERISYILKEFKLIVDGKEMNEDDFFDYLINNIVNRNKKDMPLISLEYSKKGLLQSLKKKEIEEKKIAKISFIKYLVNETISKIEEAKRKRDRSFDELKKEMEELKSLENACKNLQKSMQEITENIENLRKEIDGIQKMRSEITLDRIDNLKNVIFDKYIELESVLNKIFLLSEDFVKIFEDDPEKKSLKIEIIKLKDENKSLRDILSKKDEEIKILKERISSLNSYIEKLKSEFEEFKNNANSEIENLRKEISNKEKIIGEVFAAVENFLMEFGKIRDEIQKLSKIEKEILNLKNEYKEL